jgi:putative tryptophan/tyrosine transport system substrate-binding protein
MIRRREFITLLGGTAAAWPVAARAQQAGKVWRIGLLENIPSTQNAANLNALRNGLRAHGYIEGQNLGIDYRSADGRNERFSELAGELVRRNVDVIVTRGTPAVQAAKDATAMIPVVMAASGDPLGVGVVAGLAQPGTNVTGLSAFTRELLAKRLEVLKDAIPSLARPAFLSNFDNPVAQMGWEEMSLAASKLHFEPILADVRKPEDLARAFETTVAQRADALVVVNDTVTQSNRGLVVGLAAKHRLPATYAASEFAHEGGLMAYSVSYPDLYRRAATFIDKIFKGARPADLPVEQPTKFELVINLKTAKALGLEIPPMLLARADEVIG